MNDTNTIKKAILDCCKDCDFNKNGYCSANFEQKVIFGCYYRCKVKKQKG